MHGLVIALLIQILVVEYLIESRGLLHPYLILVPEALSAIAMLVVLLRIMGGARVDFDWRYGLFIVALLFTLFVGYTVQDVPDGAMLAGARSYLKFLPFFLLPAVHRFTPKQLQAQLTLVLALALMQMPLAFYQRFVEFAASMHTGDPVKGTLTTSSAMSMFLVAVIAGCVTFYLRGRLSLRALIVLCAALFLPTTINETKATLLLLPFALLVPAMLMPGKARQLRKVAPVLGVGFVAVTAFVLVYNYLIQYREYAGPISEYFTTDTALYYLYTGAANTDQNYIGRFDSIEIALEHTSQDPLRLAFGYGAGNVSESFLPEFAGQYWSYFTRFDVGATQITAFLWEIGVVGVVVYLYLLALVARDALTLARSSDAAAPLGQIWAVAAIVMTFALVYKSVFSMNDIGYLFFYFSGVVASRAVAVRHAARKRVRLAPASWRLAAGEPRATAKG
ncbi:MAG TPA: hypothetical protein VLI71_13530 [Gammaproteobacteria bacterium]|nr:hypothetical protein [Gammaproteobacteria bacterium]